MSTPGKKPELDEEKLLDALRAAGWKEGESAKVKIKKEKGNKTVQVAVTPDGDIKGAGSLEEITAKQVVLYVCTLGALASCQREDLYNISADARYIVKPQILNTLGKKAFDSPVEGSKDKVYMWFGNQGGNGTRYPYYDYTSQNKEYGAVYGNQYPDSLVGASNGITPNEVINTNSTTNTVYPLTPEQKANYKYIVLVKVCVTACEV